MAKKRTHSAAIVRAFPVRAPAPIIRVAVPRVGGSKKAKKKGHRRSSHGEALTTQRMIEFGLAGAALGFLEKSFPNLPTIPFAGVKGTLAIAAYYFSDKGKKKGLVRDIAIAATTLAGYQMGKEGHISGDVMGDIAPQVGRVHGVAAQV